MKTYVEIIETATGKVVDRIDVSERDERGIDKVERGVNINLNHEEYHTEVRESEVELTMGEDD